MATANKMNMNRLVKAQDSALRLICGTVKSTPVTAKQFPIRILAYFSADWTKLKIAENHLILKM